MALKGRTTIQLFDAKSGKLVRETHDENMVTNAISNILNPPFDIISTGDVQLYECLQLAMPIQTKGMAGIMIFSNNIEENANHVIPMPEDTEVGHAGDTYSGTNPFRGSYNVNESKALSNGYRHVWDFGTDKANGDINCVCLTSREGGNTGVAGAGIYSDDKYAIKRVSGSAILVQSSQYIFAGLIAKDLYCFYRYESGKITLRYYRYFNTDTIRLADTADETYILVDEVVLQISNITAGSADGYYVDSNGVIRIWYYTGNELSICKVNIKKKQIVEDKKITIDYSTLPSDIYSIDGNRSMSLLDNYVIVELPLISPIDNNKKYECVAFNTSGKFVKRMGEYSDDKRISYFYDTKLKALCHKKGSNSDSGIWITENLKVFNRWKTYDLSPYSYSYTDISPYLLGGYYGNTYFSLYFNYCYLASINNLASTVTKTSEQTMKITYEITET